MFFEIFFETLPKHTWEEAESCLGFLRSRPVAAGTGRIAETDRSESSGGRIEKIGDSTEELLSIASRERELEPGRNLGEQ